MNWLIPKRKQVVRILQEFHDICAPKKQKPAQMAPNKRALEKWVPKNGTRQISLKEMSPKQMGFG